MTTAGCSIDTSLRDNNVSDKKSLNRIIVPVGQTKSERRASIITMFEAVHGRPSTADELADLDRSLERRFGTQADENDPADQSENPRTTDDSDAS